MDSNLLPIIAIDGPAGVGKSTIAHALAERLNLPCLDTGAMFRFAAFKLGEKAVNWPEEELRRKLRELHYKMEGTGDGTILLCNGEEADERLRQEAIGNLASRLASLPVMREEMRRAQQEIGQERALVAEGRDMGTVVFPRAAHKFFLDARPAVRAKRRFLQLKEKGENPDLAVLEQNIRERDERDRTRKIAPLVPAKDAIIIDTSDLDLPEVLARILASVSAKPVN